MKSIKTAFFSTGFRFFLNLCGFLSAAAGCFVSGAVFFGKHPLTISAAESHNLKVLIFGLFLVVVFTFSILFLFRLRISSVYKDFKISFILDPSGFNYLFSELLENLDMCILVSDLKTGKPLFKNNRMNELFDICPDHNRKGWTGDIKNPPEFMLMDFPEKTEESPHGGVWGWKGKSRLNEKWYSVRVCSIQWHDGRVAALHTAFDISSIKKRESSISDFARNFIRCRENQLKKISVDLHEQVAQDLASLRIALDSVFYGIESVPEKLHERTRNMSIVLQDAISHLREIAYGLTPSALDDFGIEKALHQFCSEFAEKNRIRVNCVCSGLNSVCSECELSINIFRIIQETVSRIGLATSPSYIGISIIFSAYRIIVKFESDGRGYEINTESGLALAENELDLFNIRERIRLIGGEGLRISSGEKIGVFVSFEIPGNFEEYFREKFLKKDGTSYDENHIVTEYLPAETRPYKTSVAKKFLLFCKDGKNDSEPQRPDQYQSHVQWRR
jgi:signal transduction histidine kinase